MSVLSTTCSSSAGETCQHQLLCSSVPWGCLTAAKRKKKTPRVWILLNTKHSEQTAG